MNHKLDSLFYSLLVLAVVVASIAILQLKWEPRAQFLVLELLVIFYLVWGVVYHNIKKNLTNRVVGEYVAIALISAIIGFLVFFI